MTKEKQIEEMAIISCSSYCRNKEKKCAGVTDCDCKCVQYHRGEALYNAGYRKQSEGEWIEHIEKPSWLEDDVEVFYECSICKTQSPAPTKFCPNCGAKMKGGAE